MESLTFFAVLFLTVGVCCAFVIFMLEVMRMEKINSQIFEHLLLMEESHRQGFENIQDDIEKVLRYSVSSVGGENNWDNIRNAFGTSKGSE